MSNILSRIDRLSTEHMLPREDFIQIIARSNAEEKACLYKKARELREFHYGADVYIRGLIEVSNYCKNDCYYCGIRCGNTKAERYRLNKEEILECCHTGYQVGFRTFVLQGGEDLHFTDELLVDIVSSIRKKYPDCAITLSLGERSKESYRQLKEAGADRYLLRHETANPEHYGSLHPKNLTLSARKDCLWHLKELGYQVGTGFMVGSPYQTVDDLAEDLLFIHELQPQMVGIGPFIPHKESRFANFSAGSVETTLTMLALLRLILPKALLPATTALGTLSRDGREQGMLAGANVVMPNLSPQNTRNKYMLYNNKLSSGAEAGESLELLQQSMGNIGYQVVEHRGDSKLL